MIKPEELKIGNLIHVPSTGQTIPVTAINMDLGVWVNRSLGVLGFDQIDPTPLTEEWLLKFGFEKSYGEFTKKGFSFRICSNEIFTNEEYNPTKICKIDFVHQLQNLFFALTREELTLKHEG